MRHLHAAPDPLDSEPDLTFTRSALADPFQRIPPWAYAWLVLLLVAATVHAVSIPWYHAKGVDPNDGRHLLLFLTGLILALDLPLSLWRFKDPAQRREYLRGWVWIDGIAAMAFLGPLLGNPFQQDALAPDLLLLAGLAKLIKVGQVFSALRLRVLRLAHVLMLGFVFYWMVLAVHWISCGWVLLREIPAGTEPLSAYLDALYWTGTTLTTVGYGDIVPQNRPQEMYALMTMIVGLAFFGYLVGMVAAIWSRRDPARARFHDHVEQLSHAVRATGLPLDLQKRIHSYYEYMRGRDWYDESGFLATLPPGLREEVAVYSRQGVIRRVEMFRDADPAFLRDVARNLVPEVITPGGYLFREGDEGRHMYFVYRGTLEVLIDQESRVINTLGPGDFFGEIALFTEGPRTASIRACEYCDVYALSKAAFDRVLRRHPESSHPIDAAARARALEQVEWRGSREGVRPEAGEDRGSGGDGPGTGGDRSESENGGTPSEDGSLTPSGETRE
jgi:voltage-gated potassium channel